MFRAKNVSSKSGTQFIAIVVLTIVIFLLVDFARRATAGYYVAQAEERLQQEIQDALALKAELEARRDYVASDAFVEEWARQYAHMVRPGDKPVFVVTPDSAQAQIQVVQSTQAPPTKLVPNWYQWWRLFFGD